MKRQISVLLLGLLLAISPNVGGQEVEIATNVGVMRATLYDDVPRHVQAFVERAKTGAYDGTLFTRVIRDFMIQGGAPDSRGAAPGHCSSIEICIPILRGMLAGLIKMLIT